MKITSARIAAIFFLILFDPSPAWVDGLVYLAVAVTVISGVDFFFGLKNDQRTAASSHSRVDV